MEKKIRVLLTMYVVVWIFETKPALLLHMMLIKARKKGTEESVRLFLIFYLFVWRRRRQSRRSSWGKKKEEIKMPAVLRKISTRKKSNISYLVVFGTHKMHQKRVEKVALFFPRFAFWTSRLLILANCLSSSAQQNTAKIKAIDHRRRHQQACNFESNKSSAKLNSTSDNICEFVQQPWIW